MLHMHDENNLDDEELLILQEFNAQRRNLHLAQPYW